VCFEGYEEHLHGPKIFFPQTWLKIIIIPPWDLGYRSSGKALA
jgi:hypothetical protein